MTQLPTSSHANGFLFADLRDYTAFVESHGDRAAADLLAAYRGLVRAEVERSPGAEIRTEGDSFYVVFPSASSAMRTGLAILDAAQAASQEHPERPIRVGIGIHAGETEETAEGLVGSAVNIAARVCSQAKAGELLVTDIVRGLTRTSLPYTFTSVGTRRLKGIAEPVALYRVDAGGQSMARRRRSPRMQGGTWTRPRMLAGGLVLVLLAGVLGASAFKLVGASGGSPSPPPSLAAEASPLSPGAASTSFPATVAERELLDRLPLTVFPVGGSNCRRASTSETAAGTDASIHCDLGPGEGATFVIYQKFRSAGEMSDAYGTVVTRNHVHEGDCAKQPTAWRLWFLTGSFDGEVVCYPDTAGHAWVFWTYAGSFTVGTATRNDSDWRKLYEWWDVTSELMAN